MSVESRTVTQTGVWTEWEGHVVNGVFPLRRFLGGSNHSAVFLTECKGQTPPNTAIKFVPVDTVRTEALLSQWGAAATLSHPHLIRLFDVGRWQFAGRRFLFIVMEYAEQTLAQVLPKRTLSPDEVREMLLPTLDALAFLHRNCLVHGQLKPSNFLVVNDQLKLASDSIRPAGNSTTGIARASSYDPPELKDGRISAAGDIWSLGITMVEALAQYTPTWPDERSETASLPTTLPPPFVETMRRCLSRAPANRPTVIELEAQFKPAPRAPPASVSQPLVPEAPREATPSRKFPQTRLLVPAIASALVILLAVWVGLRLFHQRPDSKQSALGTSQASLQQAAPPVVPSPTAASATEKPAKSNLQPPSRASRPPDQPSLSPTADSGSVLHEEIPDVPRHIRNTIHGHIKVTVRVLVGPSGNVVGELLENPGPSRYFAQLGADAGEKWRFAPADNQGSRVWLLRFEFTRGGATGHAAIAQ